MKNQKILSIPEFLPYSELPRFFFKLALEAFPFYTVIDEIGLLNLGKSSKVLNLKINNFTVSG